MIIGTSWEYNGRKVEVEAEMCNADHSVGIMGAYPEWVNLTDSETGDEVRLTEDEYDKVLSDEGLCKRLSERYESGFEDDVI